MRMYISIVFILLILINVCYGQEQDKDESLDAAIKSFQQAIEKNPKLAEAHYNLGILYNEKGMVEEAVTEYKKNVRD